MLTQPSPPVQVRRPRLLLLRVIIWVALWLVAGFLLVLVYALTVGFPASSQTFVDCHDGRGPQPVADSRAGVCSRP